MNLGQGSLAFQVSVVGTTGSWLTFSPSSASVTAASPASLTVAADPARLTPGTYTATIVLSPASGSTVRIPITVTISAAPQTVVLSQTGLSFTTVSGGGAAPAQKLQILNSGQGSMSWSVAATTATGHWLTVNPTAGSSAEFSSTAPEVLVTTDATGLTPGRYYGRITLTAPTAPNSPQTASVVLNVLSANTKTTPVFNASRLVFVGALGGSDPSSQGLLISNVGTSPVTFTSTKLTNGGNWLKQDPTNGSVVPGNPSTIVVQPAIGDLDAGVYNGSINFQFSDGSLASVQILLVVTNFAPPSVSSTARAAQAGCVPSKLFPAFAVLPSQFSVPAAWPVALLVDVVDDCGNDFDAGAVVASFSNGDPPLSMLSIGGGRWSATWVPGASSVSSTSVTVDAQDPVSNIKGSSALTGGVNAPMDAPVIRTHGIVNSANGDSSSPLAPGSLISITGTNLASSAGVANSPPLPNSLNGTSVLVAGVPASLSAVSPQQIDAILPADLSVNTTQQIIISRGDSYSLPQGISVAPAQPAIFMMGSQVAVVDAQFRLLGPQNPAKPGDTVVVFATGLGSTNPPIDAGTAAPAAPLAVAANSVSATVGGEPAQISYAGLAPGLVGVYQINLVIPADTQASSQTSVVLTAAGLSSAVAMIPVAAAQ